MGDPRIKGQAEHHPAGNRSKIIKPIDPQAEETAEIAIEGATLSGDSFRKHFEGREGRRGNS
jgi:hypothetical protein